MNSHSKTSPNMFRLSEINVYLINFEGFLKSSSHSRCRDLFNLLNNKNGKGDALKSGSSRLNSGFYIP